jgi:hypothetical protein
MQGPAPEKIRSEGRKAGYLVIQIAFASWRGRLRLRRTRIAAADTLVEAAWNSIS